MGIGSFICLIGAIVQTAAKNSNFLIAGRVVLGLGASIAQTAGALVVCFCSFWSNQRDARSSLRCRTFPPRL
jgi:hypothetical protein